jgi:hypothetical protein
MESEEGEDREHYNDEADEINDTVHGAISSMALSTCLWPSCSLSPAFFRQATS